MKSAFGIEHEEISKGRASEWRRRKTAEAQETASGAAGAAGAGAVAATPVRRSASKVSVTEGRISADDAKKILSPGYRPGNKKAIRVMAQNEPRHIANTPTTVIRYKDGSVIPFDGNHRATARIARGDPSIPVRVVEGGDRPTVSAARNVYHLAQRRLHQRRMRGSAFAPTEHTPKHAGEPSKLYTKIANASKTRSGEKGPVESLRLAGGPSTKVLRGKQVAVAGTGAALLGTAGVLHERAKEGLSKARQQPQMSNDELRRRKRIQSKTWKVGGGLGLLGTGLGVGAIVAGKPGGLRAIQRIRPTATEETSEKLKDAALYTGLTAGGVGGASSFNSAAISRAEARRRNPVGGAMSKSAADSAPTFGEEGFSKAWSALGTDYEPERKRLDRNLTEQGLLYGAGTGISAAGGWQWHKSHKQLKNLSQSAKKASEGIKTARRGRVGMAATGTGLAAVGAGEFMRRKRRSPSWASY